MSDLGTRPQVTDDTIEVGEATLVNLTLTTVIKGEMPRIGVGKQRKILAINERIDEISRDFVFDRIPGKLTIPRPFVYKKLFERFTKPLSELEMTEIKAKFPPEAADVALSFISTLTAVYDRLAEDLPVAEVTTYLGPSNIQPMSDKLREFWLIYWVADDPLNAYKLMSRGALLPEQTELIKDLYPSIYNYMKVSILNALTERKLAEPKFMNLRPMSDRGLATFKQMRVVDFGPNIHVVPPNDPMPTRVKAPNIDKGLQTKGERVAAIA